MASDRKGFWQSTAGVVTGIAGVITGAGAIVGALAGTGVIGGGGSATTTVPGGAVTVTTARGSSGGGSGSDGSGSGSHARTGSLSATPGSLEFGPALPRTRTVTVTYTGSGSAGGVKPTVEGSDSDAFKVENDSCSDQTLQPGDHCSVDVRFAPSGLARTFSAKLVVDSDDARSAEVTLRGAALLG